MILLINADSTTLLVYNAEKQIIKVLSDMLDMKVV